MNNESEGARNFIAGAWRVAGQTMPVKSPRHDQVSVVPLSGRPEVDIAVLSAKKALPAWAALSVRERSAMVRRMAEWLKFQYGEEAKPSAIKLQIMNEVGKPLPEADIEVIESATFIEYFCDIAPDVLADKQIQVNQALWPTKRSIVMHEPVGVVGVIKPWNYPLEMPVWGVIPALLAGNTVVLKPSEKSPTVGLLFGEMALAADLPPGVLNVVSGDRETGKLLVNHDDVDMIAFTGSVQAGRWIAEQCGKRLRRVTLELGGNDAAIVLSDANVELVANGLTWGAFCNAGQVCVGIKRAYIPALNSDSLLRLIVERAKSLRLGADVGPIVDEVQLQQVQAYVDDAVSKGARVLLGGTRVARDGILYFEPTVLTNVGPSMRLASEECFGPVLPITLVKDEEEAIRLANDSDYGLGASIWTSNKQRGVDLARRLRVGMVWVNDVNVAFAEAPWGGIKQSGIGFELSADALLEFISRKHVSVEESEDIRRFWWYPYN